MNWLDITVNKWMTLSESLIQKDVKMIISILYDIDFDILDDMPYDEVLEMENDIQFLFQAIPKISKPYIELDDKLYLIDFNRLEFGAFVDLEYYLHKDKNWYNNLPHILQVLYRRVIKEEDAYDARMVEPYHNYSPNRKDMFRSVLFVDVWGAISRYIEFRERIFTTYEGMFNPVEEQDEDGDPQKMMLTAEERKEIEREKRINKWGYELLALKLAKNDPLKIGEALEMPMTRAFNLLALMFELEIE